MSPKFQIRLGTLFAITTVLVLCVHFLADSPRRTLAEFRSNLQNQDTDGANTMLPDNVVVSYSDARFVIAVKDTGFAGPSVSNFGSVEQWEIVEVSAETRTVSDLILSRQRFKVRGLMKGMPNEFNDEFVIVVSEGRICDVEILHPFFVS